MSDINFVPIIVTVATIAGSAIVAFGWWRAIRKKADDLAQAAAKKTGIPFIGNIDDILLDLAYDVTISVVEKLKVEGKWGPRVAAETKQIVVDRIKEIVGWNTLTQLVSDPSTAAVENMLSAKVEKAVAKAKLLRADVKTASAAVKAAEDPIAETPKADPTKA